MKNPISASLIALILAGVSSGAVATAMPPELLGTYAPERTTCAAVQKGYKLTGMLDGVVVKKDGVSFIESSCSAKRVSKTGEGAYSLLMKCSGEGEEWNFTGSYQVSGNVLTIANKDGAERFKRCAK
jgi:hypothetical protein